MSTPKEITARQNALALAVLAQGITAVPYKYPETRWRVLDPNKPTIDFFHATRDDDKETAIEALAAAAEALGLEPDPTVQQQEQDPTGMLMVDKATATCCLPDFDNVLRAARARLQLVERWPPEDHTTLADARWCLRRMEDLVTALGLSDLLLPKKSTSTPEGRPQTT